MIQSGPLPSAAFCNAENVCRMARVLMESFFKTVSARLSGVSPLLLSTPSSVRSFSKRVPSSTSAIQVISTRVSAAAMLSVMAGSSASCRIMPMWIVGASTPVWSTRFSVTKTNRGINRIRRNVLFLNAMARSFQARMKTFVIMMHTAVHECRTGNTRGERRRRRACFRAAP